MVSVSYQTPSHIVHRANVVIRSPGRGGGGGLPYEKGGDARLKFWIKTPKGDQSGDDPTFFDP